MVTENRENKLEAAANNRQDAIVVLEDIHDPHNAAAVFRSSEAFGVQEVCLIFEQEKKWNPKKVGKATSSSANKWLSFTTYTSAQKCLSDLRRRGYRTYATTLRGGSMSMYKTTFRDKKVALIFGNEHRGVSDTVLALADEKLHIPMRGFVQSLNISVTAGICLFELSRQRQRTRKKFLLSPQKRKMLTKHWK